MEHIIKNEYLSITISEDGAELQSILGKDGTEYLWQGNPAYWSDRAINIFPYVARLKEESYYLDGALHHMKIHGIAMYCKFDVVEKNASSVIFELSSNNDTYRQYPRAFSFRIHYRLAERQLNIIYEVENRDSKAMYFGLGGHPGFNVPLVKDLRFEDYRLRFTERCCPQRVGFTENLLLSGEDAPYPLADDRILPLKHKLFDEDAIVLRDVSHQITLESDLDDHSVTVTFPQMRYLGLWHWPKTDAPYVCIEPWCSLPSADSSVAVFEEQPDLICLQANGRYFNQWSISVT